MVRKLPVDPIVDGAALDQDVARPGRTVVASIHVDLTDITTAYRSAWAIALLRHWPTAGLGFSVVTAITDRSPATSSG
jgi:hypothetical protein